MHLILTGATGLVGSGVLDAMLKMKDVTKISILSRRPVPMADDAKDPRVNVIINKDFEKYDPTILSQLSGATGCVWALGISQTQVDKEQYVKITKTFAVEAAKAFATLPPKDEPFRFVYVSGGGATVEPGRFTQIFGRVKGETELELAELRKNNPLLQTMSMRAGWVDPSAHEAIKPYIPQQFLALRIGGALLGPPIRAFGRDMLWSPTESLGGFLTEMAKGTYDDKYVPGKYLYKLGDFPILENPVLWSLYGQKKE
ncbi:unnamed protein product [Clonostachys rhizophaga]|uniref:Nucleoside-diphosphate-sugar epimerase n=1 Tax=Clonostachys rhizophaga TaxID=160324 RepID=A0A9N9YX11_9HYPO|nr:unnamed protein product [Clonostachys rhizophaga]